MSNFQQLDISELGPQSLADLGDLSSPPTTGYLFSSSFGISVGSEQKSVPAELLESVFQKQTTEIGQIEEHERRSLPRWSMVECFGAPPRSNQRDVRSVIAELKEIFSGQASKASEEKWLSENRTRYAGEWIALSGNHLIAHSNSSAEVIAAARAVHPRPLVVFIEPTDKAFAGW